MAYFYSGVDPTYIYTRKGTENDPFIFLKDKNHIRKGIFILKEIPSFEDKFEVVDKNNNKLNEKETDELGSNDYRVDYSTGVVYFDKSRTGEEVTCKYWGTGYVSISADRIWYMGESDDPLKSLQDALEDVDDGIETLEQVGNLDFLDEYSDTYQYKKWNFVTFNNKTYVAIKNTKGNKPINSEYWRLVSSGVGFSGVYDNDTIYAIGDMVSDKDKKNLYVSKKDNNSDNLNDESWELIVTLDDSVEFLMEVIEEQKNIIKKLKKEVEDGEAKREESEKERDSKITDGLAQMEVSKVDIEENESVREASETERKQSEDVRKQNESDRERKENSRKENESLREQENEDRLKKINSKLSDVDKAISEAEDITNSITETKLELEKIHDEAKDIVNESEEMIKGINGWVNMGSYDESEVYQVNNIVNYKGSTYQALMEVQGISPDYEFEGEDEPEESEEGEENLEGEDCWTLIAEKGKNSNEITVEEIEPDENGNISLEDLELVGISKFEEFVEEVEVNIGDLTKLRTARKDSVVDAINELKGRIDELIDLID